MTTTPPAGATPDGSARRLARVLDAWALTDDEAARILTAATAATPAVTGGDVEHWLRTQVPPTHRRALDDLAEATDTLTARLRDGRVPRVVRRAAPGLGGSSLLDIARTGDTAAVARHVRDMFDLHRLHG